MYQVKTKLSDFSAAHRLIKGYQGKCRDLHGHNYIVHITLSAKQLDEYDFVADFSDIKLHCETWLKDNWDHCVIVSDADTELLNFVKTAQQHYYVIPEGKNTTVEVLSHYLFNQFTSLISKKVDLGKGRIQLLEVEIWESITSCARYTSN